MATFCLVHGAWHGGWAWDRLAEQLEVRGHSVVAPDLPCDNPEAGVVEYAAVVGDALAEVEDAIVVGHSLAGVTIPLVPASRHVYLCAYVPQPGRALTDRDEAARGPGFAKSARRDELQRSYWPDLVAAAQDLQYPPEAAELTVRLRPQGRRPSVDPSPLTTLPDVPVSFVVTTEDYAIPPDYQRRMAREELGVEPIELASGHSPMLTHPRELAAILDALA